MKMGLYVKEANNVETLLMMKATEIEGARIEALNTVKINDFDIKEAFIVQLVENVSNYGELAKEQR